MFKFISKFIASFSNQEKPIVLRMGSSTIDPSGSNQDVEVALLRKYGASSLEDIISIFESSSRSHQDNADFELAKKTLKQINSSALEKTLNTQASAGDERIKQLRFDLTGTNEEIEDDLTGKYSKESLEDVIYLLRVTQKTPDSIEDLALASALQKAKDEGVELCKGIQLTDEQKAKRARKAKVFNSILREELSSGSDVVVISIHRTPSSKNEEILLESAHEFGNMVLKKIGKSISIIVDDVSFDQKD